MHHRSSWAVAALLLATTWRLPVCCCESELPPALVVVVSVDQWRYEYFERFERNLSKKGVARRSQTQGLWFDNCFHQHAFTYTGPGHSVLMTGAYPNRTGIIDNNWYDRETSAEVYCVLDSDAKIIGTTSDEKPVSPRRLLVDTLGDQLKLASNGRGKVFGVAIKDRAAILMAGRLADAAYWMSGDGQWITCDHYGDRIPGYLRNLSDENAVRRFAGKKWELLHAADRYVHGKENSEHERPLSGMSADFPHVMPKPDDEGFTENYIKSVACSPFGNVATLDAAREIVIHEKLGDDAIPDILAINLSSTDYVGHAFGPYSLEVEDMTYRTDAQLGEFAEFIDERLGERPWLMLVTADHGVAPVPERAEEWGLLAKRDPLGDLKEQKQKLEAFLQQGLTGKKLRKRRRSKNGGLVQEVVKNQVFLNHQVLQGENLEFARRLTREFLLSSPFVAHAATREQLLQDCSGDEMLHMLQRSYHARRSGDVVYALNPYMFTGDSGATHGSPWRYDRHVPLMVLSPQRLKLNSLPEQVSPASIAPTLSRMLRVEEPSACAERRLEISVD